MSATNEKTTTLPPRVMGRRIRREVDTVSCMVRIYCRAHHGTSHQLCQECSNLEDYAMKKLKRCPFQDNKTTCSKCKVHCYSHGMRERIIEVMRYAGPRMILHHPFLAITHLIDEKRSVVQKK